MATSINIDELYGNSRVEFEFPSLDIIQYLRESLGMIVREYSGKAYDLTKFKAYWDERIQQIDKIQAKHPDYMLDSDHWDFKEWYQKHKRYINRDIYEDIYLLISCKSDELDNLYSKLSSKKIDIEDSPSGMEYTVLASPELKKVK